MLTDGETRPAVEPLFIRRTTAALRFWLLTKVLTPLVSVNLFFARDARKKYMRLSICSCGCRLYSMNHVTFEHTI